ncbi:MAG: RimK family alpha-L-glutamate ligase [Planctomycetota bacterium]|nr:MAG: RimK family alpha-L-glutamate ligase [Planctomycetota bacterium]
MRLVAIGEPSAWHMRRIGTCATSRGHAVEMVRWREMAACISPAATAVETFLPVALEEADVVVVRGMPGGGLEEVILRMDLLGRLAARGTPVINSPRSLETAIDKYLSLARLAAAGIAVPATVVAQDAGGIGRAWESLGGDAVVKPLFGSEGRGIERISTAAHLKPLQDAAGEAPEGIATYLQEFVPHGGWDVRILLIGEEVFAIRRSSTTDWRTNLARGGTAEPFAPPADWISLARRAAGVLEVEVAGVDILPASDGRVLVLEVNAVPGWRGLEAATGLDPTTALVRWAETRVRPLDG